MIIDTDYPYPEIVSPDAGCDDVQTMCNHDVAHRAAINDKDYNTEALETVTMSNASLTRQYNRSKLSLRTKNFWTIEEDKMLLKLVQKYGHYGYW